jgi:hypothetical protein
MAPAGEFGNKIRDCAAPDSIHVSPEALGRRTRGCPPSTGTTQVSQAAAGLLAAYARRPPSGENLGLPLLFSSSWVSCIGSPSGRSLT